MTSALTEIYRQCHYSKEHTNRKTRMVQLPATAIEYVAACSCPGPGDFCPGALLSRGGVFCPGGLLSGGFMPVPPKFNAYTHRLGFL